MSFGVTIVKKYQIGKSFGERSPSDTIQILQSRDEDLCTRTLNENFFNSFSDCATERSYEDLMAIKLGPKKYCDLEDIFVFMDSKNLRFVHPDTLVSCVSSDYEVFRKMPMTTLWPCLGRMMRSLSFRYNHPNLNDNKLFWSSLIPVEMPSWQWLLVDKGKNNFS